ncbi:Hsp70 family protein [Actinoplanes sp. N902-109]|uniref:Hsp70 family protein n=1 Tax=Actinoplanes sp. (strain N902-109) TaxID=649831 RepID=UPI0003293484|nr:Hsp70 family protein [Actinoplanes sp. N902-109]AGL21322.1 heat shock protein 70 [Actinoplanes sp. N902-109]
MLGVALGTSHTVAVLRRPDGRTQQLIFDGRPVLPSAVYLDTTGRLHVGRDAVRLGYAEPDRLELHPLRHLDAASVRLGGTDVEVPDLLAALLRAVAREVGELPPAVLTHPVSWSQRQRAVVATALARAGFPDSTRMVPEPVAAARYLTEVLQRPVPVGAAVGVLDAGGGTLDVAVVRHTAEGRFEVVAAGTATGAGGADLDAALVDHLGAKLGLEHPAAWAALTAPVTLAQVRAQRRFQDDVREAKEMLSRTPEAPVLAPGVEDAVALTRAELETIATPLLQRGVSEAETVIKAAGLTPGDLAGLFLVGGAARLPLVAQLLHSGLGVAPTVVDQPELPVAEGAILAATETAEEQPTQSAPAPPTKPTPAQPTQPTPAQPEQPTRTVPAQPVSVEPTADTVAPGEPPTEPIKPSRPPAAGTPQQPYPEAVDPWATGEAAALAETHGGVPFGLPGAPAEPYLGLRGAGSEPLRPYRGRMFLLVAAATVVLLGIVAGLYFWFRPDDRAIAFRPLSQPVRVAPVAPVGTGFSAAALRGGRAYFAGADDNGQLGVVAAATGSGTVAWRSTDAGTAERWESFFTVPHAVVAITGTDSTTSERRMVLLDPASGRRMWERRVASDDSLLFVGDTVVLVDRTEKRLVGLQVRGQGKAAWELRNPQTEYGLSTTKVVAVTTVDDFAGAATPDGVAIAGAADSDGRIVQIGADRSARVIEAASGKVVAGPRPNIAEPDDEVIAHNGRLIVAEAGDAHRVLAFDLDRIGEPRVLFTPPGTSVRFTGLTGCGADRVCAVAETGFDAKTAQVVAIDTAKGGEAWHRAAAQAETLVPVGRAVLATQGTSPAQLMLLDGKGAAVWTRTGVAGRIDAGNLLLFSKALTTSPDDPALTGEHLGDDPVPLGALSGVRSATCVWDSSNLACVGDQDYQLQTFAG